MSDTVSIHPLHLKHCLETAADGRGSQLGAWYAGRLLDMGLIDAKNAITRAGAERLAELRGNGR